MKPLLVPIFLTSISVFAQQEKQVVFVRVYDTTLSPKNFVKKYSDPISTALRNKNLGKVTNPYSNPNTTINITEFQSDYVGIRIELNDFSAGLPFLKDFLKSQKLPKDSELSYIKLNKEHIIKVSAP